MLSPKPQSAHLPVPLQCRCQCHSEACDLDWGVHCSLHWAQRLLLFKCGLLDKCLVWCSCCNSHTGLSTLCLHLAAFKFCWHCVPSHCPQPSSLRASNRLARFMFVMQPSLVPFWTVTIDALAADHDVLVKLWTWHVTAPVSELCVWRQQTQILVFVFGTSHATHR